MVKPHHKPLAAYRVLSYVCIGLLFLAALFSLLVGLSLSIIKPIYILRVFSTRTGQPVSSVATELRFGVWGVCASSSLRQPTFFSNFGQCFGPQIGYAIPQSIISLSGVSPEIINVVLQSLYVVLVLHLVAAGMSFLTLISSLFLASHTLSILALVLSIATALVSTVVFAIDLAVVLVAKDNISRLGTTLHFSAEWGNGPWLGLSAAILTWLAVIALSARACYCFGVRQHDKF
ncbi:hypothetical protein MIND_00858300 [Mycena indigotica]|uniref:Pali-domain-containing protein n=1 Tax=Mycena indigotica TaxID=2126181 RepID=A0A8H6SHX8_9AGAR|nr:uncharacterized protein MIND_00858300 [Mycena indigotica]KAF7299100.1 hypothetical protein MIND_00858300 [Mycena indigotica]